MAIGPTKNASRRSVSELDCAVETTSITRMGMGNFLQFIWHSKLTAIVSAILTLGICIATGAAQSTTADPAETISDVIILLDRGNIPSWSDKLFYVAAKPYMTSELLTAIREGGEQAQKAQENIWDADIFTGSQGLVHAKLFKTTVTNNDGNKATVVAEIGTTDEDTTPTSSSKYRYEMQFEEGSWKIDDIKSMEEWAKDFKSLKETFAESQQAASSSKAPEAIPTDTQNPALLEALIKNNSDEVFRLLSVGASPSSHMSAAEGGGTALMVAILADNRKVASALIEKGADLKALDTLNRSALWLTAMSGNIDIMNQILATPDGRSTINVRDEKFGFTPLKIVAYRDDRDMVRLLVSNDADANIKDNFGETTSMYCADKKDSACLLINGR